MKKILIILLATTALFSGCRSSRPVEPRFYLIEYPKNIEIADTLAPLPFTLEIIDVDVHPAYASIQIGIREEDHEVRYFVNHQWASRPQQSLERFVVTYFHRHNIFEHTARRFWNKQPDYRLFINIYNLEVVRERGDFFARLHAEFRLESVTGDLIERHTIDKTRLLERRNLNLFTRAINKMFFEELNFFARKIHFMLSPAE